MNNIEEKVVADLFDLPSSKI